MEMLALIKEVNRGGSTIFERLMLCHAFPTANVGWNIEPDAFATARVHTRGLFIALQRF